MVLGAPPVEEGEASSCCLRARGLVKSGVELDNAIVKRAETSLGGGWKRGKGGPWG